MVPSAISNVQPLKTENELTNKLGKREPTPENHVRQPNQQFVANYIISLRFIAQHVIDKKLVLSLTVGTI